MDTLGKIHEEVSNCKKCALYKGRTHAVPGEGSLNADIFFIGEAPGKNEDLSGRPFVGAAGKFLDEMLASIGMSRKDVFITSLLKCRPPGNRDPEEKEITTCWQYLERQIQCIKPKLIVLLGRYAMNRFIPGLRISQAHGQAKRYKGIWSEKQVYLPLYHPAAALYNGSFRQVLMDDFKKIPKLLSKIESL